MVGSILSTTALAGTFNANFNSPDLPAVSQVLGNAAISAGGGVGGSGCLKLTTAANGQTGSFVVEDFDGGAEVFGFRATFQARIGGGTAIPADGWSFSAGPGIPDAAFGEAGAGSGLRVTFDTYDNVDGDPNNGAGEAPSIRVSFNDQVIVATPLLTLADLISNTFVPVEILLDADGGLSITYNGRPLINRVYFNGYASMAGVRYAFGARTGGLNANHWIGFCF